MRKELEAFKDKTKLEMEALKKDLEKVRAEITREKERADEEQENADRFQRLYQEKRRITKKMSRRLGSCSPSQARSCSPAPMEVDELETSRKKTAEILPTAKELEDFPALRPPLKGKVKIIEDRPLVGHTVKVMDPPPRGDNRKSKEGGKTLAVKELPDPV